MQLKEIKKKLPAFKHWLEAAGASLLEPTNEWEVLRFVGDAGTAIIYSNAQGKLNFTGESSVAWDAFAHGKSWRATPAPRRRALTPMMRALLKRDGNICFWCGGAVEPGNESADHLVARTSGGPSHISNYVLMHRDCNSKCNHMPAIEKIRAHVAWRLAEHGITI